MSFLNKVFSKEPKPEMIGNLESVCPHCEAHLDKRPSRKKKCPHCDEYIYVRTRPADQKKVLVTEEQRDAIDVQWMKVHGTYEIHKEEQREFEQARAMLRERFGQEPIDGDVRWYLLNTALMKHSGQRNWGLYRNTRLNMADHLRKEGKEKLALETYLDVAYIDVNGPQNCGGISSPELLKEFPMFDPSDSIGVSTVVHYIKRLSEKLGIDRTELKELYSTIASRGHKNLKLPVHPKKGWKELERELQSV